MVQTSDGVDRETCEEILQASYVDIHREDRQEIDQDAMELDEANLEVLRDEAGVDNHHDFQSPDFQHLDFQHHPCRKGEHHPHHEEALGESSYVVPVYLQMPIHQYPSLDSQPPKVETTDHFLPPKDLDSQCPPAMMHELHPPTALQHAVDQPSVRQLCEHHQRQQKAQPC